MSDYLSHQLDPFCSTLVFDCKHYQIGRHKIFKAQEAFKTVKNDLFCRHVLILVLLKEIFLFLSNIAAIPAILYFIWLYCKSNKV